jgi:hypothetical protein
VSAREQELLETIDRVAISELWGTYADVVNRRAFDEFDSLFRPDCTVVIDARRGEPTVVVGGAGIGAFVGDAIERYDFFEFVILSTRAWVDGGDEATGRLYMCEVRHDRAAGQASQAFGVYHDQLRRVDGRWWFASRRYHSLARTSTSEDRAFDVFDFPTE